MFYLIKCKNSKKVTIPTIIIITFKLKSVKTTNVYRIEIIQ